jgi:tetratricopeptide (TPR) repeat protein
VPKSRLVFLLLVFVLCCLGSALTYFLPPIQDRLAWRVDNAWVSLARLLNPPQQVLFVPGQGSTPGLVETMVQLTLAADPPTTAEIQGEPSLISGLPSVTETSDFTRPAPTLTPSPAFTPTPLPESALLSGLVHEPQQFNNCGPASLSMALSYWDWQGNQGDTRAYLRPNRDVDDKNVNPAEMVGFVESFTGLKAVTRVGGDLQTIKRFLAAGFPVLIEEGHDPQDDWWMGHYLVINGYDDRTAQFTAQDSLLGFADATVDYDTLLDHWRDFNYVYLVTYPPEREAEVLDLLGEQEDESSAFRAASGGAQAQTSTLAGRAQFFAWFNLGSSLVGLQDYELAAQAFDKAFEIYARLPEDKTDPDSRPFRLMWYRFGPYEAYYHTGRYQDVVDLADTTFMWVGRPVLEESFYWRALAYEALGESELAASDLREALIINPNFAAARLALENLEAAPGGG